MKNVWEKIDRNERIKGFYLMLDRVVFWYKVYTPFYSQMMHNKTNTLNKECV